MKIFSFLKHHKLSFLIALVLLFAQANFELMLPQIMSDIVDVGISQGGIGVSRAVLSALAVGGLLPAVI